MIISSFGLKLSQQLQHTRIADELAKKNLNKIRIQRTSYLARYFPSLARQKSRASPAHHLSLPASRIGPAATPRPGAACVGTT